MELFTGLLKVYGYATILFTLQFVTCVFFRLDHYDWRYNKDGIWLVIFLIPFAWPFILAAKPGLLVDPRCLVPDTLGLAAQHREQVRLWTSPPSCGAEFSYRQAFDGSEHSFGEFLFQSKDVEGFLADKLRNMPQLRDGQEGAILNWLRQRDISFTKRTPIPEAWSRFEILADQLVRESKARVSCLKCGTVILPGDLSIMDDHQKPGWNYNRIYCPKGHLLIMVRRVHRYIRRR